jgi:phage-related baseplate assembly protein
MDVPDFIKVSLYDIQSLFLANFEAAYTALAGNVRQVQPGQAEMLLINSGAYMIYLQALRVQSAALQGLAQFATYPALDSIAQPFGVVREVAQPALTTIQLLLTPGHGDLVIPAGLRVQSQDALATFFLRTPIVVPAAVNSVTGLAQCDTPGISGNGYAIGLISIILDPQAYLISAANIDVTAGGSNTETDDGIRSRLYVASGAFSCAGPDDAYISLAKTASPLITDVKPSNGGGGLVNLYVLVAGGVTSPEILAAVEAVCNPKTKRPLSDVVIAYTPEVVNYSVQIDIKLYGSVADPTAATAIAQAAVQKIVDKNGSRLNIDTMRSQLAAAASFPGVTYNAVVNLPVADIIIGETQVGVCTGVVVNLIGFNYEQ